MQTYLKGSIPELKKAIAQADNLPSDLSAQVISKFADICVEVMDPSLALMPGALYTKVDTLKANYGTLKQPSLTTAYLLGSATPDSYYNCDFDSASKYRSYSMEGAAGGSKIHGYCKTYEDHCTLLKNATSSGGGTLGLFGVRYPRENNICRDGQILITKVKSPVDMYWELLKLVEPEVQKLLDADEGKAGSSSEEN